MTAQSLSIPLDRSVFYSLYIRGLHDFLALFSQPILGEIVVLPPFILLFVGIYQLVQKLFPTLRKLKQQWIFSHVVLRFLSNIDAVVPIPGDARYFYSHSVHFCLALSSNQISQKFDCLFNGYSGRRHHAQCQPDYIDFFLYGHMACT